MKQGQTLPALAQTLEAQLASKRDYIADTRKLTALHEGDHLALDVAGQDRFNLTPIAHNQIGDWAGIPAKYYNRMLGAAPELLAFNLNHWLAETPAKRMLRTLNSNMRAFLSDRYRALDNYDLAEAVLPRLRDAGATIESCEVTDSRMYLKAVVPGTEIEIKKPGVEWGRGHDRIDIIRPGLVISNSEVGLGALTIQPAIHTQACSNLAVFSENTMRKYHVGKTAEGASDLWEIYTDRTKELSEAAFWSQIADLVTGALTGAVFDKLVAQLRAARGDVIDADPVAVVEVFAKRNRLADSERGGVLKHLVNGGDLSRYGLHSAVTRFSQDVENYDRASELERLGGQLIELSPADWAPLAKAA